MLVNELARRTGCTPRMIRYLRDQGPGRVRAAGQRVAESAVDQVIRIRPCWAPARPSRTRAPLLHCFSESNRPVARPALAAQVHRAVEDLDRQEARLSRARASPMVLLG